MIDPETFSFISSAAVTALVPLLQKAAEKGAEKLGETAVGAALSKFKEKLKHGGAKEALKELEAAPSDDDAAGSLRLQLRKAMTEDPGFAEFLQSWEAEAGSVVSASQIAKVSGSNHVVTQIVGSGNQVG